MRWSSFYPSVWLGQKDNILNWFAHLHTNLGECQSDGEIAR